MSIRISTDYRGIKVWRSDKSEYPSYAVQVSKKEGDTWINEYQKVKFKGSPDIKNGTIVRIRDAFPTLETWVKDGVEHHRQVWVVMDYDYDGMTEKLKQTYVEMPEAPDVPDTFNAIQDEIPF